MESGKTTVQEPYDATAVILAGGKSTRLGYDKQTLRINGNYLIDRILELLTPVFKEVIIVSNNPDFHRDRDCRVASDTFQDSGPLGGLHAGLEAASFPVCYLTACDMPWISVPYMVYLLECYRAQLEVEVIITGFGKMVEPMNGLYAKSLTPRIGSLIGNQRLKMTALIDQANAYVVPESVARRYSPDWRMFHNINTPEDWENFKITCAGGTER